MKAIFTNAKPIYQQIADMIADDIIAGHLQENQQVPSTTEISIFFQVNRATAQKGLTELVEGGLVYKQRGIGMFVQPGAKQNLLEKRKLDFYSTYVKPMLHEARRIGLSEQEILTLLRGGDS